MNFNEYLFYYLEWNMIKISSSLVWTLSRENIRFSLDLAKSVKRNPEVLTWVRSIWYCKLTVDRIPRPGPGPELDKKMEEGRYHSIINRMPSKLHVHFQISFSVTITNPHKVQTKLYILFSRLVSPWQYTTVIHKYVFHGPYIQQ